MRLWNERVVPYLSRREYFRKRNRLQEWLGENGGALESCDVDLRLAEGGEACASIKRQSIKYLVMFKHLPVPINWPADEALFRPTATILDLGRFPDFDAYAKTVSRKSNGNVNRAVKRASHLEYRCRIIEQDAFHMSIEKIRRSKLFRTGGLMMEAFRPTGGLADRSEVIRPPNCLTHWSICLGVIKDSRLVAYAVLTRCDNLVRIIQFLGHREVLRDGVMNFLMFDIVRSLLDPDDALMRGIRYLIYGALEHGKNGLWEWKRRLQFLPALPDMTSLYRDNLPSGFDEATYLALNPDVRRAKVDAGMHYLISGKSERRRYG
jgi:hypothetical protein